MAEVPLLLMAAGGSSRMGRPKQLLPWGEGTLIQHQVRILVETGGPVAVVAGSVHDRVTPLLEDSPARIWIHSRWEDGMGSTIAYGIRRIGREFRSADGVLIALLDQPLVPSSHFKNMLSSFRPGTRQIILSRSASGWQGVPALFDRWYFGSLMELKGEEGARKVSMKYRHAVHGIDCGDLLVDMDTPETYRRLLERNNQ